MKQGCTKPTSHSVLLKSGVSEKALGTYIRRTMELTLMRCEDVRFCPSVKCGVPIKICAKGSNDAECAACATKFCTECHGPWHKNSCAEYMWAQYAKFYKDCGMEVTKIDKARFGARKFCPACKVVIEKNGGCNHMTCKKCWYEFCWVCMGSYPDCRCKGRNTTFMLTFDEAFPTEKFRSVCGLKDKCVAGAGSAETSPLQRRDEERAKMTFGSSDEETTDSEDERETTMFEHLMQERERRLAREVQRVDEERSNFEATQRALHAEDAVDDGRHTPAPLDAEIPANRHPEDEPAHALPEPVLEAPVVDTPIVETPLEEQGVAASPNAEDAEASEPAGVRRDTTELDRERAPRGSRTPGQTQSRAATSTLRAEASAVSALGRAGTPSPRDPPAVAEVRLGPVAEAAPHPVPPEGGVTRPVNPPDHDPGTPASTQQPRQSHPEVLLSLKALLLQPGNSVAVPLPRSVVMPPEITISPKPATDTAAEEPLPLVPSKRPGDSLPTLTASNKRTKKKIRSVREERALRKAIARLSASSAKSRPSEPRARASRRPAKRSTASPASKGNKPPGRGQNTRSRVKPAVRKSRRLTPKTKKSVSAEEKKIRKRKSKALQQGTGV